MLFSLPSKLVEIPVTLNELIMISELGNNNFVNLDINKFYLE